MSKENTVENAEAFMRKTNRSFECSTNPEMMVAYAAEYGSRPGLKIPPFPLQAYLDHGYDERGNPLSESDMDALRTKQAVWTGCISAFMQLNSI